MPPRPASSNVGWAHLSWVMIPATRAAEHDVAGDPSRTGRGTDLDGGSLDVDVGADRAVVLVPARARGPDAPFQVVDDVGEIELAPPVGEGALRSLGNRGPRDLVVELAVCGEQIQRVAPGMLTPVVRARDLAAAKDPP
jgi:hypothetical protein